MVHGKKRIPYRIDRTQIVPSLPITYDIPPVVQRFPMFHHYRSAPLGNYCRELASRIAWSI